MTAKPGNPLDGDEIEKAVSEIGRKVCIGQCDVVDTDAAYRIVRRLARKVQAIERERAGKIVRRYLAFNDQRAVSWHEVQDAIEAIRDESTR